MIRFYLRYGVFLFVCCVVLSSRASSQVLYTDIVPDTVVQAIVGNPTAEFYLDLNNDGKRDFRFVHFAPVPVFTAVEVYCFPDDIEEGVMVEAFDQRPSAAKKGNAITMALSSKQFVNTYHDGVNSALFINNADDLTEPWDTGEDRYLGVAISLNDGWHFGWIRLNMPANASSFTIKDYAVELTPEKTIYAGDMGTTAVDRPELASSEPEIHTAGKSLFVTLPPAAANATLALYSILGTHAGSFELPNSSNMIDLRGATPGVYAALVNVGNRVHTKLVLVR